MNAFTNREEYLAAVKLWKASYASIIIEIRQAKVDFKASQRELSKCGLYDYNFSSAVGNNRLWWEAYEVLQKAMSHRMKLRLKATELITERQVSKEEAGRQMNSQK